MTFQLPTRQQLLSEAVRYETFQSTLNQSWTSSYESFHELASDGFYYTGETGRVACIFCNHIHFMSYIRDLYWIEHRLRQPLCPFINGDEVGNIPIASEMRGGDIIDRVRVDELTNQRENPRPEEIHDDDDGYDVHDDYQEIPDPPQTEVLSSNRRWRSTNRPIRRIRRIFQSRIINQPTQSHRRRFVQPQNIQMRTVAARLASFERWPHASTISPNQLAEAGFYYTGVYDHTRCFHCNGTLCGWEINDNAWSHHAYYFPRCHFLYLKRGQLFVDTVDEPNQHTAPLTELPEPSTELSRYTCKVCMVSEIGTVFTPCDHAIACVDCAVQLSKCPLCNNEISNVCRLKMID